MNQLLNGNVFLHSIVSQTFLLRQLFPSLPFVIRQAINVPLIHFWVSSLHDIEEPTTSNIVDEFNE